MRSGGAAAAVLGPELQQFVDDPDALKTEIKRGFEHRVLELLR